MRGKGGVAGEGRVVEETKFHYWGKCTMPLTNINSDWISIFIYAGSLSCILVCNVAVIILVFTTSS